MKKKRKKALLAKGLCAAFLCLLMGSLCGGYLLTKHRPQSPAEKPAETAATAAETTAAVQTEAVKVQYSVQKPTLPPRPKNGTPAEISLTGEAWALMPLNLNYCLPQGYLPELAAAVDGSDVQLDRRIVPAFQKMYAAAKQDGVLLVPYAGYRSCARQKENFTRRQELLQQQGLSEKDAFAKTAETILPAGCSEHNAGLAIDIGRADKSFAQTEAFSWLIQHAAEYGFILRYPEGKETKTGVSFCPYHWRYVGADAAQEMQNGSLTLEEYLQISEQKSK